MRFTSTEGKVIAVGLFLTLFLAFIRFTQPGLTGNAVYGQQATSWSFDNPDDYSYDNNLIEISNGEARLKLKNMTEEIINSSEIRIPAEEDGFEFESETYEYDGKLGNIRFEAEIPEKTALKFRIKAAESDGDLNKAKWLGPTGKKGWYTESGQEINPEHPESGYLKYKAVLETGDGETTPIVKNIAITYEKEQYPESAKIETPDLTIEKLSEWGSLITTEELNGQTTYYYYSVDSGGSWNSVNNNDLSEAAVANGKIRIKAEMNSDKTQTPMLSEIRINYTYLICEEQWEASYTECGVDDTRIKYYADANSCGTSDGLPADNGTSEGCDYCIPTWENVNGSCTESDVKEQAYYYTNACCSETGLASDCTIPQNATAGCDYCTPSWSCAGYGECQANGEKPCLAVVDSKGCYGITNLDLDSYTGDYLGFAASCAYDSATPLITEVTVTPKAVNVGEVIEIMANISDESSITATAFLKNEKMVSVLNKSLSESSNGIFTATINTSGIERGTYLIDVSASDEKANTLLKKSAAMVVIATTEALVKQITLSETSPYYVNTTNQSTDKITASLEVFGKAAEGQISIATYYEDFRNTIKPAKEIGRYVDIVAEEKVSQNITNTTLRIDYSDEEVEAANINETSIKVYFYNETEGRWEALGTTVNEIENYAEAAIGHYSTYSIFGEENAVSGETTETTEAGEEAEDAGVTVTGDDKDDESGRHGGETRTEKAETAEESKEKTEKEEVKVEKTECSYDVAVELPERLALKDEDISATITNTGTCDIEFLGIEITGEASKFINVTPQKIENLATGKKANFKLTKVKEPIPPVQGLIIVEQGRKN